MTIRFAVLALVIIGGAFLLNAQEAHAATEFVSTIQESGGDYTGLQDWETAMSNANPLDLTSATTTVFAHGGITGSISDNTAVTGDSSGATGTAVHATASQVLIRDIVGTFTSGEQVEVDGSNYVTISNAGDSAIATAKIDGTWTSADTFTTIQGWTTSATNYIRVYTTATARHDGTSGSGYRIDETAQHAMIVRVLNLYLEGLELKTSGAIKRPLWWIGDDHSGSADIRLSHNLFVGTSAAFRGPEMANSADVTSGITKIWNNTFINHSGAGVYSLVLSDGDLTNYVYNNTFASSTIGIRNNSAGTVIAKNNLVDASSDSFDGTFDASSDYNSVSDGTATGGSNDRVNQTFTFVDESGGDFHLSRTDLGAWQFGTNLTSDSNLAVTDDIDGETRPATSDIGTWDIGSDQADVTPSVPTSLGGSSFVDGSTKSTTTPNLTLSQADSDAGDNLAFQIQVDDSSDFASAVVDYTSSYLSQGATSFTVGQAAGSGSYTTGSASQTLSDTSYYWRVRTGDGTATSTYATANSGSVAFIVDATSPVISATATSTASTSGTFTWTTDTIASSLVAYGLTSTYSATTTEADTSPRVTSHSVTVSSLIACTEYNYRVSSIDAYTNQRYGSNGTFTTIGCQNSATVNETATQDVTMASGGTVALTEDDSNVSLTVPASFSAADATFQLKQMDKDPVLSNTSFPIGKSAVGNHIYDFKAYSDSSTLVSSFDKDISVIITYTENEITSLSASTLSIHRWDGSAWNLLTSCSVDEAVKTVTCTTTSFSIFGLFGNPTVIASTPGGGGLASTHVVFTNGEFKSKYATGTLVRYENSTKIYLVSGNIVQHIPDEATFLSLGYEWFDIVTIPSTDTIVEGTPLSLVAEDSTNLAVGKRLIKYLDSVKVYLLKDNVKYWITTEDVFNELGFKWSAIETIEQDKKYRSGMPFFP